MLTFHVGVSMVLTTVDTARGKILSDFFFFFFFHVSDDQTTT